MILVVDENIAYAYEAFSHLGEVRVEHGRKINNAMLKDAHALIVRSITKVDSNLLEGSKIKFVGTATIGTDHIDKHYLSQNNIYFADAKGCNADAVTEYFYTALFNILNDKGISLKDKSIGIIGAGNIGSRIIRIANVLELKVVINDPPLERQNGKYKFSSLEEALSCDVITFHVPLNKTGPDKTIHLLNKGNINHIKDNALLFNCSRGSVISNNDLLAFLNEKEIITVLDVWEPEPEINLELLNKVYFATPHIAGYSFEGKVNGTTMMFEAVKKCFGINTQWEPLLPVVNDNVISINPAGNKEEILAKLFKKIYNIYEDTRQLNDVIKQEVNTGEYFDKLRKLYPLRREFTNYKIALEKPDKNLEQILKAFRFNIFLD